MVEQVDKTSILKELSTSYNTLEEILASLSEKQYFQEGVIPGWTIKDILAHINSWHFRLLKLLDAAVRNEEPSLSGPENNEELDSLNAQFYQENKQLSLGEVQAAFHTSYHNIFNRTQSMTEEDLVNPHRFAWTKGEPLWRSIAGDTYEHYQEHILQIQEWLTTTHPT